MFSTESPQTIFDTKGYITPDRFEEFYIDQKILLEQEKQPRAKTTSLENKISKEQLQYDKYYKQYQHYDGKFFLIVNTRKHNKYLLN